MFPGKMYVPKTIGEVSDFLGMMMISSPTFSDPIFVDRNVETVFSTLNAGLHALRVKLGEPRFARLVQLSDEMRAHFEADPEDKTAEAIKGREVILQMKEILRSNSSR